MTSERTTSAPNCSRQLRGERARQQPELGGPGRALRLDDQLDRRAAAVGRLCAATCSPTSDSHRLSTLAPAAWACQPRCASRSVRADTERPPARPGSRPAREASGPTLRLVRRVVPRRLCAARARASVRARAIASRTRSAPLQLARLGFGFVSHPRLPLSRVTDVPAPTDKIWPRKRRRHISCHRGRDEHLLGRRQQLGEPLAAGGVELGEHVVEQQHRLAAAVLTLPQELVGRQPQRQRQRPRLALAGVATGREARRSRAPGRRGAGRPATRRARSPAAAAGRVRRASARGQRRRITARLAELGDARAVFHRDRAATVTDLCVRLVHQGR